MTVRYLGGKSRIGKKIAVELINPLVVAGAPYYEPFCGACWVTQHVKAGWRLCTDANPDLIAMWSALQRGWFPPDTVSEAEYAAAKLGEGPPELRAFIGFGCSFGGKWFGGYARGGEGRSYASNARNSLMRKLHGLAGVHFEHADYRRLAPRPGSVIYCDPPYAYTTGYGAVGTFDSSEFWNVVRNWSKTCTVLVSEYAAPEDFECVAEFITKLDMRDASGRSARTERLYATRRDLPKNT